MVAGCRLHSLLFARRDMRLKVPKKKLNGLPAVRIADFRPLRHCGRLVGGLIGLLLLFALSTVKGQEASNNSKPKDSTSAPAALSSPGSPPIFELSERDLSDTVASFKSNDPKAAVGNFKAKMPAAVTDVKIREEILRKLPETVQKLKIEDAEMTERFRQLIAPVLELYGREKIYDIIIVRHRTPVMFSDTGVVLVVSTGMIARAESDDELLGFVAHEVAHEYFARYSIYSKHLLKLIAEGGNEAALKNKLAEALALIELQCDAFAALTVSSLNRQPLAFIAAMERIGRDFPNHAVGFHPPDRIRRQLIEQLVPKTNLSADAKLSPALEKLKQIISTSNR